MTASALNSAEAVCGAHYVSRRVDIALVGATSLIGESLIELLEARDFPVDKLHLLDTESAAGKRIEFRGRYLAVAPAADFDFSQVRLALFVAPVSLAADQVPRALEAGARVIDASTVFAEDAEALLAVADVDPEGISASDAQLIVSPSPMSVQLAVALAPLQQLAGLGRVQVATYQAVSERGRRGIEELGRQTADLLNMRGVKTSAFARQIAFNVLGRNGKTDQDGYTAEEQRVARQTKKLLACPELAITVNSAWVPVFYGHCAAVTVETREPVELAAVREAFERARGVELLESEGDGDFPTPVTDAAQQDAVFIGRLRRDPAHPHGLNFWVVADNVRRGAALNVLQIAELLGKH